MEDAAAAVGDGHQDRGSEHPDQPRIGPDRPLANRTAWLITDGKIGMDVQPGSPEEMRTLVASQIANWKKVVAGAKIPQQ